MKKVVILLVAALAIAFAANTSFANDDNGDTVKVFAKTLCGLKYIGTVCAEKFPPPGDDYVLVKKCFGKYYWMKMAVCEPCVVTPVCCDDWIKVYKRTICGKLVYIGKVCADRFDPPGDDYVLVKKCFGKYYWLKMVCCDE